MSKILKSPKTTAVVSGIGATLALIFPAYAEIIACVLAVAGTVLPGIVKPETKRMF